MIAPQRMLFAVLSAVCAPLWASDFSWAQPGDLTPGSGTGTADLTVFAPGIRFPLELSPAFANSQVYGNGGQFGPSGGQCAVANYQYPWRDNFCESRNARTPSCPNGTGHQGQDIRPATCRKDAHWAVAAEDGRVVNIGVYSVWVLAKGGTLYKYLHMNMNRLAVTEGVDVAKGQRLGLVSNHFGKDPTTIHLHFEVLQNIGGAGMRHVPPYMSLVRAYGRLVDR